MFKKKIKETVEQEKHLHYNDGPLQGKQKEVGQQIMAYTQAAKWFEDRVAEDYRKKAKSSRRLSIFFGLLAFMSILAVMMLTPLKTVVPMILRVDKSSGYVDVVKPSDGTEKPEVVEDKHFIHQYILARESYNWSSQRANYRFVQLTSSPDVFEQYKNFQLSSKGYVARLEQSQQIQSIVESIVLLPSSNERKLESDTGIKTYQVRLTESRLLPDGKPVPQTVPVSSIILISIDNKNPAITEGDQWLNPLGYGVKGYSKTMAIVGSGS